MLLSQKSHFHNMVSIKKRLARMFEGRPHSFCEFCGIDTDKYYDDHWNTCRFCRKSFCKEHWNAPNHNCKKRMNDPHLKGLREVHHAGGGITAG